MSHPAEVDSRAPEPLALKNARASFQYEQLEQCYRRSETENCRKELRAYLQAQRDWAEQLSREAVTLPMVNRWS